MSESKKIYTDYCKAGASVPLFFQPWWLDLVCTNGQWNVVLSFDKGGQIRGALPYYQKRAFGIRMIRMPQLTPYLGLWLHYPDNPQKRTQGYAFEKKVITELLQQLPRFAFAAHHHPVGFDNGLPFVWQGYELSNWYTYRVTSGTAIEKIKAGMKASVRNKVDKAEQSLRLTESTSPEEFYQINQLTFDHQGISIPYSLAFFQKIDKALSDRNQRKIWLVKDKEGLVHAAIYLVWDQKTLYNLALGTHPERRKSGAVQLLLWKSICLAMAKELDFDFEGSMIENIESVFRDFGGERVAYLRTTRYGNRWWGFLGGLFRGI